jgi:hypothetical protein
LGIALESLHELCVMEKVSMLTVVATQTFEYGLLLAKGARIRNSFLQTLVGIVNILDRSHPTVLLASRNVYDITFHTPLLHLFHIDHLWVPL